MGNYTATIILELYEIETDSGNTVRFHDYEIEDGGLRVKWEYPRENISPFPRSTTWGGSMRRVSGTKRTVYTGFVPLSNLENSVVSPTKIGEVHIQQDYKKVERESGWFFKSTEYKYKSTGDVYVEYEPRRIIE